MEDIPVGCEIILKVVEDKKGECNGCFYYEVTIDMYADTYTGFRCGSTERKDGKNIHFKRIK